MHNPFIGTWTLLSGEIAEPGQSTRAYVAMQSMKVLSKEFFSFVSRREGAFYGAASGSYHFDASSYTEVPQLASWGTMQGEAFTFSYRIEGELWHNERFDGEGRRVEYEVWQRCPE